MNRAHFMAQLRDGLSGLHHDQHPFERRELLDLVPDRDQPRHVLFDELQRRHHMADALPGEVVEIAGLENLHHAVLAVVGETLVVRVHPEFLAGEKLPGCVVRATVKVTGPTGVEMEALTAVSVACLTIYDMIKAVERGVRIEGIHLVEKIGGKSGHYRAED